MSYVIAEPCAGCLDRSCVPVCPVEAIYADDELPEKWQKYAGINAVFVVGC